MGPLRWLACLVWDSHQWHKGLCATLTLSLAFDQLRKHTPLEQMLQGVSSTLKVRVLLLASLHSERLALQYALTLRMRRIVFQMLSNLAHARVPNVPMFQILENFERR